MPTIDYTALLVNLLGSAALVGWGLYLKVPIVYILFATLAWGFVAGMSGYRIFPHPVR